MGVGNENKQKVEGESKNLRISENLSNLVVYCVPTQFTEESYDKVSSVGNVVCFNRQCPKMVFFSP